MLSEMAEGGERTQREKLPHGFSPRAHIQYQDAAGMWQTFTTTAADASNVSQVMRTVALAHPGKRIRCVDEHGELIDLL